MNGDELNPDTERSLRLVLADRAAAVRVPPGMAESVVRRRRVHQRGLVVTTAAVAATAVALGVPVAVQAGRHPTTRAAGTPGSGTSTRGSLAGDTALLAEAVAKAQAGWTKDDRENPQDPRQPISGVPDFASAAFAEQVDGYVAVLVVGGKRDSSVVFSRWETRGPGQPLVDRADIAILGPTADGTDAREGIRHAPPAQFAETIQIAGRDFGAVLFPPGTTATVSRHTLLAADCTVPGQADRVPLVDGAGLFAVAADDSPILELTDPDGQSLLRRAVRDVGSTGSIDTDPRWGPAVAAMPGTISALGRAEVRSAVEHTRLPVGEQSTQVIGLWGGAPTAGYLAAMVGSRYPSGAVSVIGLAGSETDASHFGGDMIDGCVPAGGLDRRILTMPVPTGGGDALFVVVPRAATRAEAVRADGAVVQVALIASGGFVPDAGSITRVRAYDAAGGTIDDRAPGSGLVTLPVHPH